VLELPLPHAERYQDASQRRRAQQRQQQTLSGPCSKTGAKAANDSHATDDSCGKAFDLSSISA